MHEGSRWAMAVLTVAVLGSGGELMAASAPARSATNVVLVHGAFADGSSWSKVIPLLQAKGLKVTAVGLPLTSFADDVAAARRAIAAQDGPTVLVRPPFCRVGVVETGDTPRGPAPLLLPAVAARA